MQSSSVLKLRSVYVAMPTRNGVYGLTPSARTAAWPNAASPAAAVEVPRKLRRVMADIIGSEFVPNYTGALSAPAAISLKRRRSLAIPVAHTPQFLPAARRGPRACAKATGIGVTSGTGGPRKQLRKAGQRVLDG